MHGYTTLKPFTYPDELNIKGHGFVKIILRSGMHHTKFGMPKIMM